MQNKDQSQGNVNEFSSLLSICHLLLSTVSFKNTVQKLKFTDTDSVTLVDAQVEELLTNIQHPENIYAFKTHPQTQRW